MAAAYGSDDFSGVDNMCLGDCGIVMKATKFVITNCEKVEVTTTEATTTEAVTEPATAAETTAAAAAAETEAPSETGGGSIPSNRCRSSNYRSCDHYNQKQEKILLKSKLFMPPC